MAANRKPIAVLTFIETRPGPQFVRIGMRRIQPARTVAPVANTNKLSSSDSLFDVLGSICRTYKILGRRNFTLPIRFGER